MVPQRLASSLAILLLTATRMAGGPLTDLWLAQESTKEPAGSISGGVIADSGQPLQSVAISLSESGQPYSFSRSTTTDDEGRFTISRVPRAVYTVNVFAPGY